MKRYVIFGKGRVGSNMARYLCHLGADVVVITRDEAENRREDCAQKIARADIVMAAIPDDRLTDWYDRWQLVIGAKPVVHFSGARVIEGMYGFHPLYSFPDSTLCVEDMQEMAFACPAEGPDFEEVFPGASNPNFKIADQDRARYHALAVLNGNLVSYIWNETAKELSTFSGLPSESLMHHYLKCIVDRFAENPTASQTGPVMRHDANTVAENLAGLDGNQNLIDLYKAFLNAAWPDYPDMKKPE